LGALPHKLSIASGDLALFSVPFLFQLFSSFNLNSTLKVSKGSVRNKKSTLLPLAAVWLDQVQPGSGCSDQTIAAPCYIHFCEFMVYRTLCFCVCKSHSILYI